jgi:hypothetical protein
MFLYLALISKLSFYIAEYAGGFETNTISFIFGLLCFCFALICLAIMVVLWASIESKVKGKEFPYYFLGIILVGYIIVQIIIYIIFVLLIVLLFSFLSTQAFGVYVVAIYVIYLIISYFLISVGFIIFGLANTAVICLTETGIKKLILPLKLKVIII